MNEEHDKPTGFITITVPCTEEPCGFRMQGGGTYEEDGARGVFACRDERQRNVRTKDIVAAMHAAWVGPASDYEKRLAEIEAIHEADQASGVEGGWDPMARDVEEAHTHRGWLLSHLHAASAALTAAGILEDMGSPAERIAHLNRAATAADDTAGMALRDMAAASAALTALGVPEGGSLAERVKALLPRGPAPDADDVSPAHLAALEIVTQSDGSPEQARLGAELIAMGPLAVAEAVCRAYEEGRAAEARRPSAGLDPAPDSTRPPREPLMVQVPTLLSRIAEQMQPPPEPDIEPAVGD